MIITSQEPTNPANGTRPNLQVDPVGSSFLSHHPWQKMPIRQNRPKGLQHDSCATENFFSKPYNNRCKALEGSHNNHSNSTNREEEFSFKAPPPKTSFAALTTHVLPSNVITSHESTNPANGPRPIFGWTQHAAPFFHITPCTKCGNPTKPKIQHNPTRMLPRIFQMQGGALQGSHNDHPNSKTSGEEFSLSKCLPR